MSSTWPNASRADQSEVNLTFKGQNLPLSSQGTCACALYTKPLIDLGLPGLEARSVHVCRAMFHFAGQVSWYWKLGCNKPELLVIESVVLQCFSMQPGYFNFSAQRKILPGFYYF